MILSRAKLLKLLTAVSIGCLFIVFKHHPNKSHYSSLFDYEVYSRVLLRAATNSSMKIDLISAWYNPQGIDQTTKSAEGNNIPEGVASNTLSMILKGSPDLKSGVSNPTFNQTTLFGRESIVNDIQQTRLPNILTSDSVLPIQSNKESSTQVPVEKTIPINFDFDSSFSLPWHNSKPVQYVQEQAWFKELTSFLQSSDRSSPIILVSTDGNFLEALINWLVSALLRPKEPLANILVLTYTSSVCDVLNSKKVAKCLCISPNTMTSEGVYEHKKNDGLYRLLVIRVVVMRLVNYFGFDVANFDSDAILLDNPVPIFKSPDYLDSDVVGTFGGSLPGALRNKWGVVLCMGAIFLRSTNQTELLWESMRQVKQRDDQIKMNYGLYNLGVHWTSKIINQNDSLSTTWRGVTKDGLKLTLLPQRIACRGIGCRPDVKDGCYIWHRGRNQHKSMNMIGKAKSDGIWFLKKDWQNIGRYYKGLEWLKSISILT